MIRLLLISSSKVHGSGYLDHAAEEIRSFLASSPRVLFIPYALFDWDGYTGRARERFESLGFHLDSVHEASDPRHAVEDAEAIFIGGGNTFRLLERLHRHDLLSAIRRRARQGIPYVGTSAGSNVACPTIRSTNDMPIVEPPSFEALDLVPFNLNPHYLDAAPGSTHQGETREQRIREFLEENDRVVVGLREGGMLRIEDTEVTLTGSAGARVFRREQAPEEFARGTRLDFLIPG